MPCQNVTVSGGESPPPGNGNGGGGEPGDNRAILLAGLGVVGVGLAISSLSDKEE